MDNDEREHSRYNQNQNKRQERKEQRKIEWNKKKTDAEEANYSQTVLSVLPVQQAPFRLSPPTLFGNEGYRGALAKELNRQVAAFGTDLASTSAEQEIREKVVENITKSILVGYPDASVRPYGSFVTGLCLPTSDIDIGVHTASVKPLADKKELLRGLRGIEYRLRRGGCAKKFLLISKAKVPILKFTEQFSGVPIDISVNETSGDQAIPYVLSMTEKYPFIRPFTMLVKLVLNNRDLNNPGTQGLGSWAVFCMVVSFISLHPCIANGTLDLNDNLGVLLMEFFEFFGKNFDEGLYGLRMHNTIEIFQKTKDIKRYHIFDPVSKYRDVAKAAKKVSEIKSLFAKVHDDMMKFCQQLNTALDSGQTELPKLNDSLVSLDRKTINLRKEMARRYASGELQRRLGEASVNQPIVTTARSDSRERRRQERQQNDRETKESSRERPRNDRGRRDSSRERHWNDRGRKDSSRERHWDNGERKDYSRDQDRRERRDHSRDRNRNDRENGDRKDPMPKHSRPPATKDRDYISASSTQTTNTLDERPESNNAEQLTKKRRKEWEDDELPNSGKVLKVSNGNDKQQSEQRDDEVNQVNQCSNRQGIMDN